MFDPVILTHDQIVEKAIEVRNSLTPKAVADGFLASLSSRRLDLRSALGSFAVLRFFPGHPYSPADKRCDICGMYEPRGRPEDLNILNFERHKWGGVRHDQPLYAMFDLSQFVQGDRLHPTSEDVKLFHDLIRAIETVSPETPSARLEKSLSRTGFKSNKAERDVLIGILGLAGILGTRAHPGYLRHFVNSADRELPSRRFVDMHYPACWWQRSDGVNREALSVYFGHVL